MMDWFHACAVFGAATSFFLADIASGEAAGAMAIGKCAAYGYSYDYAKEPDARMQALRKCAGGKCKVVATMRRGCAAFAIDGKNACGAHGYAVAQQLGQAQNVALRYCYKYGGRNCVIRAFACDAKG
jgi:uncharacterized protein (DUF2147 family)